MTTSSEIFLDTNLLVYYTFKDFEPVKHEESRKVIDKLRETNTRVTITTQNLREFYAVVTGKKYFKSPLTPKAAGEQILIFSSVFNVADITQDVIFRLIPLAEKYKVKGRQIYDTTIVATMLHLGAGTVLTYNKKDFIKFREIRTIEPSDLLGEAEESVPVKSPAKDH